MTRILRRRFHPSRHSLGVFAAAAIIQASIIACASATSAIHCVLAAPRHGAYGFLVSLRQNGVGPEKNCADAILPKEHGVCGGKRTAHLHGGRSDLWHFHLLRIQLLLLTPLFRRFSAKAA